MTPGDRPDTMSTPEAIESLSRRIAAMGEEIDRLVELVKSWAPDAPLFPFPVDGDLSAVLVPGRTAFANLPLGNAPYYMNFEVVAETEPGCVRWRFVTPTGHYCRWVKTRVFPVA